MVDSDARRLTELAYFLMMSIGVTFSLAGVVTADVAKGFGVDAAVVGYAFTLFTAGYSLAIFGNGFVLAKVDVRKETVGAAAAAGLAVAGAASASGLAVFAAALFVYGLGLGVLCSVGYYLVVSLYSERIRAAKLNVLNFFFGMGAVIAPILAGQLLQRGGTWQWVFLATVPLMALAAVWAARLRFAVRPSGAAQAEEAGTGWSAAVFVIAGALLCYVLSEMMFTYWIVVYMMERLGLTVATASVSLSVFWALMAAGRLAAGRLIERLGVRRYILVFSLAAVAAFAALLGSRSVVLMFGFIAVMGLGYSGLYATILTFGTLQVARPSSRLTTFYLVVGAAGGILSFVVSSWMKQVFGVGVVLMVAAALMGAVVALTWCVGRGKAY